jgi:hypothetical protein
MAEETANSFRLEEYKTLRAELDDIVKAMRQVEIYTVAGMTAVYVWLATNRAALQPGSFPWWIPVPVVVIGFLKNRAFLGAMRRIARQMLRIEEAVSIKGEQPLTWYHQLTTDNPVTARLFDMHDYILWPTLLVGSVLIPYLAKRYLHA